MANTIQLRRGAAPNSTVLAAGEPAYSTTEGRLYVGDGTSAMSALASEQKGLVSEAELMASGGLTSDYRPNLLAAAMVSGQPQFLLQGTLGSFPNNITLASGKFRIWAIEQATQACYENSGTLVLEQTIVGSQTLGWFSAQSWLLLPGMTDAAPDFADGSWYFAVVVVEF